MTLLLPEIDEALLLAAERRSRSRRTLWRIRERLSLGRPLVVALALLGASGSVGGLALAGTFDDTPISPQAWVDGQRVQPERAITPAQSAQLEILRRPRVPSDALPGDPSSWTDDPADGSSGANPALSRSAQGLPAGAAWLIPGDGMICVDVRFPIAGGGGTCQPDATVNAGQVLMSGFNDQAPGIQGIAGIVPDGVTTITIAPSNGPAQSVSVHENIYMTEIALGGFTVSFNGPDGPVTMNGN